LGGTAFSLFDGPPHYGDQPGVQGAVVGGGSGLGALEFPVTASALAFLRDEIDRLLEETEPDPDRPGRYRHKPQTPPEDRA